MKNFRLNQLKDVRINKSNNIQNRTVDNQREFELIAEYITQKMVD